MQDTVASFSETVDAFVCSSVSARSANEGQVEQTQASMRSIFKQVEIAWQELMKLLHHQLEATNRLREAEQKRCFRFALCGSVELDVDESLCNEATPVDQARGTECQER